MRQIKQHLGDSCTHTLCASCTLEQLASTHVQVLARHSLQSWLTALMTLVWHFTFQNTSGEWLDAAVSVPSTRSVPEIRAMRVLESCINVCMYVCMYVHVFGCSLFCVVCCCLGREWVVCSCHHAHLVITQRMHA